MITLRAATWNIRLGLDGGLDAVAEQIRVLEVDVIALQEVGSSWRMGEKVPMARVLAEGAGVEHAVFAGALHDRGGAYGIALLSRWPIVAASRTALPRFEDEQRVLLQAGVERPDGRRLDLFTTHLSIARADRDAQLDLLAERVQVDRPQLLLGDLNTAPGDPRLADLGMRTTWGPDPPPTWPVPNPTSTLDYIFVAEGVRADEAVEVASRASDHLPVVVGLELP